MADGNCSSPIHRTLQMNDAAKWAEPHTGAIIIFFFNCDSGYGEKIHSPLWICLWNLILCTLLFVYWDHLEGQMNISNMANWVSFNLGALWLSINIPYTAQLSNNYVMPGVSLYCSWKPLFRAGISAQFFFFFPCNLPLSLQITCALLMLSTLLQGTAFTQLT